MESEGRRENRREGETKRGGIIGEREGGGIGGEQGTEGEVEIDQGYMYMYISMLSHVVLS